MSIAIDGAGRVVIPKPIRDLMHLRAGDEFDVEIVGEGLSLVPLRPRARMVNRNGVWVRVTGHPARYDAVEEVEKSRLERERQICERANAVQPEEDAS